jgi:hypothetical protein
VSRLVDLTGRTFGQLTVVGRGPSDRRGKACWRCRCACGGETLVIGDNLRRGNKPLERAIEHPCAPCVYGEHERCLDPISDNGNCCDELDGWADRE